MRLNGSRVAIANRGEIAIRIARTCRRLGATPVLIAGEPDRDGLAAREIGLVEIVGEAGSELYVERVVGAAVRVGADYLHPGYGFLSERAELSEACATAGIRFVGPSPETLRICGDKLATRAAARQAGVPVLPASDPLGHAPDAWLEAAQALGYPLLVKPAEAGGGRGLRRVTGPDELIDAIQASRREIASTGSELIYLERELPEPRHVEVQVAGSRGEFVALGDRDCSVQRRHQKVIEEAPAPNLDPALRMELHEHARAVAAGVELNSIATCEFLLGRDGTLAFLEVNPRIQVEHPVTEMVTGVDLVEWQLRIADGEALPLTSTPQLRGHSIEARVYAEDPHRAFFPSPGKLTFVAWPSGGGLRVDAGYATGDIVPSNYDSMIAKVIAYAADRDSAVASLRSALTETIVAGVEANLGWLLDLLENDSVKSGSATTATAGSVPPSPRDRRPALVAVAAHLAQRMVANASDAWSVIGPWRHAGSAPLYVHGEDFEDRISIARSGEGWIGAGATPESEIRCRQVGDGTWNVQSRGSRLRFAVIEAGDSIEVAGAGGRWLVGVGPQPPRRDAVDRPEADGRVKSPLPATVLSVHVQPGDEVFAQQPLVTLYAMKMELVCPAPTNGTVTDILCEVGLLVDADQLLVEIEPLGSD